MYFHLIPAVDHGFDGGRAVQAGGGQVNVADDERSKQPGNQAVEGCQDGQTTEPAAICGTALHAPHQGAGDDLQAAATHSESQNR